ncbi:RNA-dependent RNA polymerase [Ceratobasidium sp. AG-Ba]|nr:RNA-dependent RNA polymerase [Ceratobasidium sp. AG-Ba]
MSLLYFSNLHSSVGETVLRDAITKAFLPTNNLTNKPQFTLSLQLPDEPAAGVKNVNGIGSIRFHNEELLDTFMAKLKTEPIMFKSQTVEFTLERPQSAMPVAPVAGPSARAAATSAFQATEATVATTRHTPRRPAKPAMNLNKSKHKYGQRPRKTTPRVNPKLIRREQHRLSILGHQPRLSKIHFGVLRNNKFSIEWSKELVPTAGWLKFDDDEKTMRLIIGGTHQVGDSLVPSIAIGIQTVTWVGLGNDGVDDFMFLELVQHPHFEQGDQYQSLTGDSKKDIKGSRNRLSRLDERHGHIAPYASRWIMVTFHEDTPILLDEDICLLAGLPQPIMNPLLVFESDRRVYSPRNIALVESWLRSGSLPWEVMFQCEALFRNGTLIPKEILLLRPQIEKVTGESVALACDALKMFQDKLKGSGARTLLTGFEDEAVTSIFQSHVDEARKNPGPELQNSSTTFICHHVKVTPTAVCLDGPYAEQSNRVIRRYPGYESYFIRVSFKDEGESRTRLEFEVNTETFSAEWIGKFLKTEGIKLADRHYKLLGYSSSGFREHACFFMADFTYGGALVTPDSIRASLGEFSKVIKCPARYGARMSQAFSSTDPSIILTPQQITHIPDLTNRDGEVFSDGCGTISPLLAEKVWKAWVGRMPETRRRLRHQDEPIPAAFQFRMGGCKGMVRIDPKLEGEQLCIRPSMTKFEAPGELGFEIARAFERPSTCFLNRPLVMLLVSNGVDPAVFEKLMEDTLNSITTAMQTFNGVRSILVSNRLGRPYRLGDTFGKLSSLGIELDQPGFDRSGYTNS